VRCQDLGVAFGSDKDRRNRLELGCGQLQLLVGCVDCESMSGVTYSCLRTPRFSQEWSSIIVHTFIHRQVVPWKRLTLENILSFTAQYGQERQSTFFAAPTDINS
jgi:hypothetical protein